MSAVPPLVEITRRALLRRGAAVGWGAFAAVLAGGSVETVRFFFPRVVFRPPSTFRIGTPRDFVARGESDTDAYGVLLVDERWKASQRFFVVRERDRIFALSARCAHLGCTVNWFADLATFKCPCHGSEYHSNGTNFAGPAPAPLPRLRIELDPGGELVVDTSIVYGPERFQVDGAFVRV
jgi:cytochrome b6-f complex iron-sulfur subunit